MLGLTEGQQFDCLREACKQKGRNLPEVGLGSARYTLFALSLLSNCVHVCAVGRLQRFSRNVDRVISVNRR